ncbi:unnamed protein product, partial [Prorocentrum cordatum]
MVATLVACQSHTVVEAIVRSCGRCCEARSSRWVAPPLADEAPSGSGGSWARGLGAPALPAVSIVARARSRTTKRTLPSPKGCAPLMQTAVVSPMAKNTTQLHDTKLTSADIHPSIRMVLSSSGQVHAGRRKAKEQGEKK